MPRRNDRRPILRSPEPLGGVLARAERAGAPGGKPSISHRKWEAAVGARIAERAQPIELYQGTLVVRVATSVWASELSLLATPILERLAAQGLTVRALRYRVGAIEAAPREKAFRASRSVPEELPLPAELAVTLASVEDPELRAVIGEAARANLAWQAYVGPAADSESSASASATPSRAARVPRAAETESGRPVRTGEAAVAWPRRRP